MMRHLLGFPHQWGTIPGVGGRLPFATHGCFSVGRSLVVRWQLLGVVGLLGAVGLLCVVSIVGWSTVTKQTKYSVESQPQVEYKNQRNSVPSSRAHPVRPTDTLFCRPPC